MGQLPKFYRAADVAFVGGSLVAIGGHNFIEAASAKVPIILGPHLDNFATIAAQFKHAHACEIVTDSLTLAQAVLTLLDQPEQRRTMIHAADQLLSENTGALAALLQAVDVLLQAKKPA
jgi:3-deoxy-D-manno-octulosonic-acid transferase